MRPTRLRRKDDDERILPLINVVFLLLIFFMLAGHLAASDPFEIAPPRSASEAGAEDRELQILLSDDGRLALDGVEIEEAGLVALVAVRVAESASLRVQFKADGRSDATQAVAIMEQLREAGVKRLKLLTVSDGN